MIETEDRLRSLMSRVADAAPMPPPFDELGTAVGVSTGRRRRPALVAVWAVTIVLIVAAGVALAATRHDRPTQPTNVTNVTTPFVAASACELVDHPFAMTDDNLRTLIDYLLAARPDALSPDALRECKGATSDIPDRLQALVEERRTATSTP